MLVKSALEGSELLLELLGPKYADIVRTSRIRNMRGTLVLTRDSGGLVERRLLYLIDVKGVLLYYDRGGRGA